MIAIGGAIGTGLFVASGETISVAGPGGALIAYGVIGLMVYFLMTSLGEMATYLPVSGSFGTYASRYVDGAFGFAVGVLEFYPSQLVERTAFYGHIQACNPFQIVVVHNDEFPVLG
ncbi:MAG: hypothetical protein IIU73_04135, partial [Selenomonadales bacterium]|nr:hypothetical protein [Selenomonadales bacterium]